MDDRVDGRGADEVAGNADDPEPGAATFRRIDRPSTPERFVSGIAVDPTEPDRAWISYSGYGAYTPSTPGHVFEALYDPATHSAAFTDLSAKVGDQPVTGIAFDATTCSVYAATDFGVLGRPGGSSAWIEAGSGLPRAAVYGLALSQRGNVLYAATHGRGAYALSLPTNGTCPAKPGPGPSPSPSPAPGAGTASASLKRIGTVRLGKPTKVRGRVAASDGVGRVYRRARSYEVRVVVTGAGGERASDSRRARVCGK